MNKPFKITIMDDNIDPSSNQSIKNITKKYPEYMMLSVTPGQIDMVKGHLQKYKESNILKNIEPEITYFNCKNCGELIVTYYNESFFLEGTNAKFISREKGGLPFTTVNSFKCNNCNTTHGYMMRAININGHKFYKEQQFL